MQRIIILWQWKVKADARGKCLRHLLFAFVDMLSRTERKSEWKERSGAVKNSTCWQRWRIRPFYGTCKRWYISEPFLSKRLRIIEPPHKVPYNRARSRKWSVTAWKRCWKNCWRRRRSHWCRPPVTSAVRPVRATTVATIWPESHHHLRRHHTPMLRLRECFFDWYIVQVWFPHHVALFFIFNWWSLSNYPFL